MPSLLDPEAYGFANPDEDRRKKLSAQDVMSALGGLLSQPVDYVKGRATSLLTDPIGDIQRTLQGTVERAKARDLLTQQAYGDPSNPLRVTDQAAADQLTNEYLDMASTIMPMGMVAPQAKALKLAQERAALPIEQGGLGLPPNNTSMDRAKAMGFKDAFHETESAKLERLSESDAFNVSNPQGGAGDPLTPFGVFTKPTGKRIGISRAESEVQMPLMIAPIGKTKSFSDRQDLLKYINEYPEVAKAVKAADDLDLQMAKHLDDIEDRARTLYEQGKYKKADKLLEDNAYEDSPVMKIFEQKYKDLSIEAKKKLTDLFKEQGFGNVYIKRDTADGGLLTQSNIVLDPSNVRSRFAAFDPFRRNENNILAGALPFGLLSADEETKQRLRNLIGF